MEDQQGGPGLNLTMLHWSYGAYDMWQKHAPLHNDVTQSDVCSYSSHQAGAC